MSKLFLPFMSERVGRGLFCVLLLGGILSALPLSAEAATCQCTCAYRAADGTTRVGNPWNPEPTAACTSDASCGTICDTSCATVADTGETYLSTSPQTRVQCAEPLPAAPASTTPTPTTQTGSPSTLYNPLGDVTTIPGLIQRVIGSVLGIIGALALLMFIVGGVRWITAGGNDEAVAAAKTTLKNATIGLLMIFFSYMIIQAFISAFNAPPSSTKKTTTPGG